MELLETSQPVKYKPQQELCTVGRAAYPAQVLNLVIRLSSLFCKPIPLGKEVLMVREFLLPLIVCILPSHFLPCSGCIPACPVLAWCELLCIYKPLLPEGF